MTAHDYRRLIGLRTIGGRDAAPQVDRGLCGGYTARCRSLHRGVWLETPEYPGEVEALAALLAMCIADGSAVRHEISKHCPLFDVNTRQASLFGGA